MNILITIGVLIGICYLIGGIIVILGEVFSVIGEFINSSWENINASVEDYGANCGFIIGVIVSIGFLIYCTTMGEDHSLYNLLYRENDSIRSSTKLAFILIPILLIFLFTSLEIGQKISVWIITIVLTFIIASIIIAIISFVIYKIYGWIMA